MTIDYRNLTNLAKKRIVRISSDEHTMNQSKPNPNLAVGRLASLRRLIQDPEDTAQVFEIIEPLGARYRERLSSL
ncbi:MAG: hypothetical protein CM1200mP24_05350 [Gammaproteobacteria bacterium]|nr:MAG: hypothetical protein CM1200mP24_05350 [Gammaproteobacteria bacterium]